MHIEIVKCGENGFQVRGVDAEGRTIRMFTYPKIEVARRAASAWTVAYGLDPREKERLAREQYERDRELLVATPERRAELEFERKAKFGREVLGAHGN
jgi:hypothetical protein